MTDEEMAGNVTAARLKECENLCAVLRRLLREAIEELDAAMAALREPPAEMANYIRETSYRDGFFSLRPSLKAAADWIEHNVNAAPMRHNTSRAAKGTPA